MKNEDVIPPQNGIHACDTINREHEQLWNQLVRAQETEIIGQLAAGAAHDFKNILSVILFQLDEIRQKLPKDGDIEIALSELEGNVERGITLTSQMLSVGHGKSGEFVILKLSSVLDNLLGMLRRLIEKNIKLTVGGKSRDIWLKADRCLLERALLNLVINARDAMPEGGHVHIKIKIVDTTELAHQQCNEAQPGRFVRISVTDTGCGMSADTMDHAFEPFFTTKPVGKGSGLGLATIRHIVKQHKGWLEVKSDLGKGSTFALYFPICNPPDNPSTGKIEKEIPPRETTTAAPQALPQVIKC